MMVKVSPVTSLDFA